MMNVLVGGFCGLDFLEDAILVWKLHTEEIRKADDDCPFMSFLDTDFGDLDHVAVENTQALAVIFYQRRR